MSRIETIIIVIIVAILGFLIGIPVYEHFYNKKHPCIQSHTEIQYKAPASVVVGNGKYGGGVAIPIGNMKPVSVEVCDLRAN